MVNKNTASQRTLVNAFKAADLTLVILDAPMRASATEAGSEIFEMNILRIIPKKASSEVFRIYPGHIDNRIQVLNVDKHIKQLVLLVHEPERSFVREVRERKWLTKETFCREYAIKLTDVISLTSVGKATIFKIRSKTSSLKRHYLCGMDDRQLFIAQLRNGVSTVANAHASLKSPTVTFAEGKAPGRTKRQGEWFFVNPTKEELSQLKDLIKAKTLPIRKNMPIGAVEVGRHVQPVGNPHTAEEIVVITASEGGALGVSARGREMYVRGKVRHKDHPTVSFSEWRKVIRNREASGGSGINWID